MKINFKNQRIWQIVLVLAAAHVFLLITRLLLSFVTNLDFAQPFGGWELVTRVTWNVLVWVLITPFILWVGYLFRITRSNFWRHIFLHFVFSIIAGLILPFVFHFGLWALGESSLEYVQNELFKSVTYIRAVSGSFMHYPTVLGIQQAYLYFRESQERAFRLQEAELQMLKMQLHPHFFFNTLNAISALIYRSPKDADRMITKLGDLFRVALRKDKTQEIELKEELEFLDALLQIHKTLMGKRLRVLWKIEPETLDALVPNLILQPLVENAIKHGVAPLEEGGLIEICAEKKKESLVLRVRDNGIGLLEEKTKYNGGIGLENTRARLENLYNGFHRFEIKNAPGGGVIATIELPFREQPDEADVSFDQIYKD